MPQSGICPAPCVLRQCTVVFAWKCHLFCLCAHVQCRVCYIYHVEFHFRFRRLLSFPVKHQLRSGCHGEKSSKKIPGNFLRGGEAGRMFLRHGPIFEVVFNFWVSFIFEVVFIFEVLGCCRRCRWWFEPSGIFNFATSMHLFVLVLWESKSSFFYFHILLNETKFRPLNWLTIINTWYFCLKQAI